MVPPFNHLKLGEERQLPGSYVNWASKRKFIFKIKAPAALIQVDRVRRQRLYEEY